MISGERSHTFPVRALFATTAPPFSLHQPLKLWRSYLQNSLKIESSWKTLYENTLWKQSSYWSFLLVRSFSADCFGIAKTFTYTFCNINYTQSHVFIYSGSLSSNFFNYKIQSNYVTIKHSPNTKPHLEEHSCLQLWAMIAGMSHSSI